ncbi:MAG: polysaccharide deacetylase family protein [Anaerolineales bacterium]|nr:polysaccharide deacetylase family protein [Anaerolineales bacterium]
MVSLTFDDGDADNYLVRSVLTENDLRATFYVVSGFTGTDGYMTEQQLKDLHADGNEIGGHTLSHSKLTDVRGADLKREVCEDRMNLLAHGFEVTSFAYPYGHYDAEVKTGCDGLRL